MPWNVQAKDIIDISYEINKQELKLSVTDTGCGIPKDKLSTIFDRFEKLDSFAQGTGLGLSICKSIVESMGGIIGVDSEIGVGSKSWVHLPCCPQLIEGCRKVSWVLFILGSRKSLRFAGLFLFFIVWKQNSERDKKSLWYLSKSVPQNEKKRLAGRINSSREMGWFVLWDGLICSVREKRKSLIIYGLLRISLGDWRDSNPRHSEPQSDALTNWTTVTMLLHFLNAVQR